MIKASVPGDPELLRDHIQGSRLAATVSAVQDRHRIEIDSVEMVPGQDLKGVIGIVAGSFLPEEKLKFLIAVRECKIVKVYHCGNSSLVP